MSGADFQGVHWKKLGPPGDRLGISFDEGPSIGPVRLLKRTDSGWAPRSTQELNFVFSRAFQRETEFADKVRGLNAIARALNKGDLAHAMLVTLFTDLPALSDESELRRAAAADTLAKAGFNPDQERDERGRWTSDSGGEARNPGGFTPAQMFIPDTIIPFLEQILPAEPIRPIPPFPGDILPPITGSPDVAVPRTLENPYPNDRGCSEEWAAAKEYCADLGYRGLLGSDGYRGMGDQYAQCVRGQVSERCGGNPIGNRPGRKKPRRGRSAYELLT